MNILVITGSPKGKDSITLHTCLYLEKRFSQHNFNYLHAGQRIKSLEKDFTPALEALRAAELIVFCYPVYTFLVPYQLHRFIELMKASGLDLSGKAATQVTTSKHFYDITAHQFIKDNCADLGLRCLDGLSADMEDILTEKGQQQAVDWMEFVFWQLAGGATQHLTAVAEKKSGKKAVIVADLLPGDTQLQQMIYRFRAVFPYECDLINIEDFPFMGGCLSCFNCAATGKCVYKDGFDEYLRGTIHKHDAIVYAFRIKDHSMGSRFKLYDDRQFCNGHRTVTMGTPFGYLVCGPYAEEPNLQLLLEARAQVGGNYLAGVATDEIDAERAVDALSATLCRAMETRYTPPQNFLGVGGMKIFRDLIYQMRGLMRADHKFFRSHGQYDFPQKQWKTSLKLYLVGWLMNNPKMKAKAGGKMSEGMIAPYKKILTETDKTAS
ncbi:MAG: NAD(P)H-dependent oxidoreductase [Bacteroidales bacterium]|nr:NAD(P)H-dependent oxidoreductase [Bacteroidales bacterium]